MKRTEDKENTYRSIFKGISIFGGVKVFEMLVNLVRGKFVAIFLGPDGMGVSSIFTNISSTISSMASLGLNLAVVKEVAAVTDDSEKLSGLIRISGRLFFSTALLGALICVSLAYLLSGLSFGDEGYTGQFMLLGLAIFFMVDNGGKLAVLQGLHEVKRLSRASLTGSITGLLFGVPLYWLFGTTGIVPAIIILALSLNIFYSVNLHQVRKDLPKTDFSIKAHSPIIRKLFSLGFILLTTSLIGTLCNYLILIIIRKIGSIDDVGFFQASNSVTNQMAGVVFTAMALDYFPRLSAVAKDNRKMGELVDRQSEIVSWIVMPVAALIILFAPLVVRVLLTSQFSVITPLLRWMALGVVMKALAYPVSYITFAKDNKRMFFWLEGIAGNILFLSMPILFFYFFGLKGFGYGMVAEQTLCLLIYWTVNRIIYGYQPSRKVLSTFAIAVGLTLAILLLSYIENEILCYCIMAPVALGVAVISFMKMKRLIRS